MIKKNLFIYIVVFVIIAVISFQLIFNNQKNKNISQINFLNDYAVIYESSRMKTPQNEPHYFFQHGWLKQGKKYLMTLPKSSLRFFSIDNKERTIYIELSKNNFFKSIKKIIVHLFLNGAQLKDVEISSENKLFVITAPKETIRKGSNFLEIYIDDDQKDKLDQIGYLYLNKFKIKDYQRRKNFKFDNNSEKARIIQPSQSVFEYFIIPKGKEKLHYSFSLSKTFSRDKIIGKVLIKLKRKNIDEQILNEIVLFNNSQKQYSGMVELNKYPNEIVKLSFSFLSQKPYLSIKWKDLFIENKKQSIVLKKSNNKLQKKPHIFLIIIDAARFDRFGFAGYNKKVTPIIDEFAKRSFNFINFFAQAPYTTASVATMLSGYYPETHTVRYKHDELPQNVISISDYLNDNGYITNVVSGSIALEKNNLIKGFKKVINIRSKKKWNSSSMQIEKLNKFIDNSNFTKPNLFYIHLLPPHEPYNPPVPFNSLFAKTSRAKLQKRIHVRDRSNLYSKINKDYVTYLHNCYLNNLNYADYLVGEIINKLKKISVFNDSIVIITSDHGEAFFEHLQLGHNTTNYNDMIQIPFLLKMPQQKKSIDIKNNYGLIDLTPTILELLGIKTRMNMQGISFAPILFDESSDINKRYLYSRSASNHHNLSLIYGDYKFIYNSGRSELYNIKDDPKEINDLSKIKPLLAGLLKQEVFKKMYENIKLKNNNNIVRKQVREKKKYQEELKSLGYL